MTRLPDDWCRYRHWPVFERQISVRLRCRVQRNEDGTYTVTVPRLSTQAWTGTSEAVAVQLARCALDEFVA